jgi:hypothetical protein
VDSSTEVFRVKGCYRLVTCTFGSILLLLGGAACLWALFSNEREIERMRPILLGIGLFMGLVFGGFFLATGLWYSGIRVTVTAEGIQYKNGPVVPWNTIDSAEVVPWGRRRALHLTYRASDGRKRTMRLIEFIDGFEYLAGLIEKRMEGETPR